MNAMIDLQLRELNTMVIKLASLSDQAQVDLVSFVILKKKKTCVHERDISLIHEDA